MSAQFTRRVDPDLDLFNRRVARRRTRHLARGSLRAMLVRPLASTPQDARSLLRRLPSRFWLHLLVIILVPTVLAVSVWAPSLPSAAVPAGPASETDAAADLVVPVGPIELAAAGEPVDLPVADSAFEEIVALSTTSPTGRQQLLAPLTVPVTIQSERANVRNGPGLEYDRITQLELGAPLTLEAHYGDWFLGRQVDGSQVWVAGELIDGAMVARSVLPEATDIPPPPPPKIANVTESGLNLRDGPGTAYVRMTTIEAGTQVDLLSRYNEWFEVRVPGGQIGWVTGDFLAIGPNVVERLEVLTTAPDPNPELVALADGRINLRRGPGTVYPRLGVTESGTRLDLVGRYEDWLRVRTPDGTVAWISNEVLGVSAYLNRRVPLSRDFPPPPRPAVAARPSGGGGGGRPAPVPAAQAGGVVAFAMQFRGVPYVWGGASPRGFDCSGFTRYVYGQFGLRLPHSAAGQYSQRYGTFIDKGSLAPGDLVFFANTYKRGISHVGIYAGNGIVVQALAPGVPLAAVSMYSGYWQSKYYGALRPHL